MLRPLGQAAAGRKGMMRRRAQRRDHSPLQRRLDAIGRLAQPPPHGSARHPAFQLDDGGAAGRLDRADPVRIEPA